MLDPTFRVRYEEARDGVAVIAAPFNRYLSGNPPDKTNAAIAHVAEKYVRPDRPFIGQWEQTSIIREKGIPSIEFGSASGSGEWVRTDRLVAWIASQVHALEKGSTVLLVGHPHHLPRMVALAHFYGLDPCVVPESRMIPYDPSVRPGFQGWCTSSLRYVPFDLASRGILILLTFLGKL